MADGPSPTGVGCSTDADDEIHPIPSAATGPTTSSVGATVDGPDAELTVGAVTVLVFDERADHPDGEGARSGGSSRSDLDPGRWGRLAAASLSRLGERGEASLTFVDRATIADLNGQHMGVDAATDVLSFPMDAAAEAGDHSADRPANLDADGAAPRLLGDIVICADVAADNAPDHAGTIEDELALLVVHGALHLLGYDHAEADEASAMREREAELLTELFWDGPAPARFRHEHADQPTDSVPR